MGSLQDAENTLIHILGEIQKGEADDNLDTIEELAILIQRAVLIRKDEKGI